VMDQAAAVEALPPVPIQTSLDHLKDRQQDAAQKGAA